MKEKKPRKKLENIDTLKVFEGYKVASEVRREFTKLLKNTEDKEAIQSFIVSFKGMGAYR